MEMVGNLLTKCDKPWIYLQSLQPWGWWNVNKYLLLPKGKLVVQEYRNPSLVSEV